MAACSSTPAGYGPAYGKSAIGYENTRLQQDRFRVSYTSKHVNESRDYALLRAAQIADAENYSHFKIFYADTYGTGGRSSVSSAVRIGRRFGGYRGGGTYVDVSAGVHDVAQALKGERVTETIEVQLLNQGGSDPNIYEASSIIKYIQPRMKAP